MSYVGSTALSFSEEQAMLLDVAREFCRDKSPIDQVRAQLETENGYEASTWDEMVALGWTGIALPESVGGSGLGVASVVPVVESMGKALLGTPLISTTLAAQAVLRAGSVAQHEAILPAIAEGQIATLALLENMDWGDETVGLTVSADGELAGRKLYVADAAVAEMFVVSAMQAGQPVIAMVKREQLNDDAVIAHTLIDQTKRAASVDFTGVTVTPEALIAGAAVTTALRDVQLMGALLIAAEATGAAASCLDTTVDYLKTRKQFGNLIGAYQALKHPCVDILTDMDSARSFVYHAATLVGEQSLDKDAEVACRMAKAQATDTLTHAGDRAVQFHGGMGFTYECDASLYIRRGQWSQQQFGDAQCHRLRLAELLFDHPQ